jgi:hypothetical protein
MSVDDCKLYVRYDDGETVIKGYVVKESDCLSAIARARREERERLTRAVRGLSFMDESNDDSVFIFNAGIREAASFLLFADDEEIEMAMSYAPKGRVMSEWEQTVEHGAASARHEADIKRDVVQAIQQARREERQRIVQILHRARETGEETDLRALICRIEQGGE